MRIEKLSASFQAIISSSGLITDSNVVFSILFKSCLLVTIAAVAIINFVLKFYPAAIILGQNSSES